MVLLKEAKANKRLSRGDALCLWATKTSKWKWKIRCRTASRAEQSERKRGEVGGGDATVRMWRQMAGGFIWRRRKQYRPARVFTI